MGQARRGKGHKRIAPRPFQPRLPACAFRRLGDRQAPIIRPERTGSRAGPGSCRGAGGADVASAQPGSPPGRAWAARAGSTITRLGRAGLGDDADLTARLPLAVRRRMRRCPPARWRGAHWHLAAFANAAFFAAAARHDQHHRRIMMRRGALAAPCWGPTELTSGVCQWPGGSSLIGRKLGTVDGGTGRASF